jgi:hypothetical protein
MGKGSKEQVNRRQYETDYSYLHGINGIQPHGLCAETRKERDEEGVSSLFLSIWCDQGSS